MGRRNWEKELGCFGYFGFGGGYAAVAEKKIAAGYGLYCNICPMAEACWAEHRTRAAEIFPGLTEELNKMAELMRGPELAKAWWDKYRCAPPDITLMAGNVEDGGVVALGAPPKNRLEATLSWPLKPRG